MVLHGLGITSNRSTARFKVVSEDGKSLTIEFKALSTGQEPEWVDVRKQLPHSRQPFKGSAACTYLRDVYTLYCNIRMIHDLTGPSKEMIDILKRDRPEKLVSISARMLGEITTLA